MSTQDGTKVWFKENGIDRHREDGPAVVRANGTKEWWIDDRLHRLDGPAIEYANGDKWWYLNDLLHRENGPAIEKANGTKAWWLNGIGYSESDYWKELKK